MNVEGLQELESPFFVHAKKLSALEEQLYGHVFAAIDLDALARLEQHLCMLLMDDFKLPGELALDLSTQILESAIRRVAEDPARHVSFGPPEGITEAEKAAVAFDETCPFCVAARRAAQPARPRSASGGGASATSIGAAFDISVRHGSEGDLHESEDEPCPCCEMLAQSWREEHADVLAKAGLAPPSSASAIAGAIEIAKRDRTRRGKPS